MNASRQKREYLKMNTKINTEHLLKCNTVYGYITLDDVLVATRGSITSASSFLGVNRSTLRKIINDGKGVIVKKGKVYVQKGEVNFD